MNSRLLYIFLIGLFAISADRKTDYFPDESAEHSANEQLWVDSVFQAMTPNERIAQLMMVRAHSDLGADHIAAVELLIEKYQVGGLCFFQGTPEKQAELTNKYQKLTKHVPLLIAMDAEWGLGMRFKDNGLSFPRQQMLGAIQDNRLIYDLGKEVARECRRLGVHVNFAPVADVNNNADNPVINTRSFGEDRYNVTAKSYMYMRGMQDNNLMACAKHFPGHGDTNIDSHFDLPKIEHDLNRLDSVELFPFRVLAQHGVQSIMVAHLEVPSIDETKNLPTTLSSKAVNDLLKEKIGFDGLIITDGLEMKGVTKYHNPGEVEAKALAAGNDILLLPENISAAFREIKRYIKEGKLDSIQVNNSVKKVLLAKYRLGLTKFTEIKVENIREELFPEEAKVFKRNLIRNALTLVRNEKGMLPFKELENANMASLSIGSTDRTTFQKTLGLYGKITHYNVGKEIAASNSKSLISKLKNHEIVIVGLHGMSSDASKDFGLTASTKNFIEKLRQETKVVLVVFGNPYSLKYFDDINWLLEAYDEDEITEDLAAQALFGAFSIQGRLPVTASPKSKFNDGIITPNLLRLGYTLPEEVGLDSKILKKIDLLAQDAIDSRATPGCVVLVAKDGQVVFHKAYGFHTYEKLHKVTTSDIYDLASVTKIAASTISIMKLFDENKVSVYGKLSDYLPELDTTNKSDIVILDVMAHRAGLFPWISFYQQTVSNGKKNPIPLSKYYSKTMTGQNTIPVTEKLFMRDDYVDEIRYRVYHSELLYTRKYKYSDLGFYMISDLVKRLTGQTIDEYADQNFYQPLGLTTATYNPWKIHDINNIPPTEEDKYFRRQKIQGYVHDMGAAMLGGVSGHAGLFADANDLAIIMQMILNGGKYGGQQYFSKETVQLFTHRHPECTRRGIGFDMKELDPSKSKNVCKDASEGTFGHLGFTGTCTWVDPEYNLVYVFLSNRTYPSMKNYRLNEKDYRSRIQHVIYEALGVTQEEYLETIIEENSEE